MSGIWPRNGPIAHDPLLFYVSPLQSWLDRLVALVSKTGTMETDWLPVFTIASTHLRSVLARIHTRQRPRAAFLCQWETGGMFLLGVSLEVRGLSSGADRARGSPLTNHRAALV